MADELVLKERYRWPLRLKSIRDNLVPLPTLPVEGVLTRMVGLTLEAVGCHAPIGARCQVVVPGGITIEAEVVGFSGDKLFLMPTTSLQGLVPNARVIPHQGVYKIAVGQSLLGRVLDGHGHPLDFKGKIKAEAFVSLDAKAINPLSREPIREILDVGVRAINSMITVGRGQRLGLFAGSGVGKSVLLGMMTRYTAADVVVVGLIGERGREVKEFVQEILGEEGLKKAVVVAAPADTSPLMRIHGSLLANSIAEYFRDQGKNVLLLMDSLTRFAQAQREIALSIGEPPATKGYPPSVFAKLPQLVERAGNGDSGGGSITAFYTVLVEGDDQNDPIADSARAILDGHIVLARKLAEQAHFPAIDIEASISRCMTSIADQPHQQTAQRFRKMYTKYIQNEDLINVGAYQKGSDPVMDEAIEQHPRLKAFLAQKMSEKVTLDEALTGLDQLLPVSQ